MKRLIQILAILGVIFLAWACGGGAVELAGTRVQGTGGGTDNDGSKLTKTVLVQGPLQSSSGLSVGGIDFGTSANTQITLNGNTGTTADLRTGMWLEVVGTYDSNTLQGTALTVAYEILMTGLVTKKETETMTIEGLVIRIDADTYFDEGLTFDGIEIGDDLTISGTTNSTNTIYASYVEKNDESLKVIYEDEDPDFEYEDDFEVLAVFGPMEDFNGVDEFSVDGRTILIDADTEISDSTALGDGVEVFVYGEWVEANSWQAIEIVIEEEIDGTSIGTVDSVDGDLETLVIEGQTYQWTDVSFFIDLSEGEEYESEWEEIQPGDEVYVEFATTSGNPSILWLERLYTPGEVELEGFYEDDGKGNRTFVSFDSFRAYTFSNNAISDADLLLDEDEVRGIIRPDLFGDDFEADIWVLERTDL